MEVIYSKPFRKALAKLIPRDFTAVEHAVALFQHDRLNPTLRDHPLKGRMKGLRAFAAGFDLRIIYRDEGGFITITLLDVGAHNQVY